MDREFAEILHRALMMIVRYLEKRYGLGGYELPKALQNRKTAPDADKTVV